MRIGVMPSFDPTGGGIFQYGLTVLDALYNFQQDGIVEDEYVVIYNENDKSRLNNADIVRFPMFPLDTTSTSQKNTPNTKMLNRLRRLVGEGRHRQSWRAMRKYLQSSFQAYSRQQVNTDLDLDRIHYCTSAGLKNRGIELMVFPAPMSLGFEIGVPFVMAVHDLQHRLQPEFPEVSADGEWERREYLFRNAARFATLLIADSEVGKEDILQIYGTYGITPDRIKVLPFLPAHYLARNVEDTKREEILKSLGLSKPYLFYPAQFWPHKNHLRIVQAIGLLKQQNLTVNIAFSGSFSGEIRERNFAQAMEAAKQYQVQDQIHYLGYVSEQSMHALYAGALALIMPTFFGPTNIPPLEAWSFGCPVITSDIRGIREQMGNAAVLVDPSSVESIAQGIACVWLDKQLRDELITRGYNRLGMYTPSHFRQRLKLILDEAKLMVQTKNVHHLPIQMQ